MKLFTTKNAFGMVCHPSDVLIHWSVKTGTEEFDNFVKQLRADWDLLHASKELSEAYDRLHRAQSDLACSEQGEIEAGESL